MKEALTENQMFAFNNGARTAFASVFMTFDDCPYSTEEYRMAWCMGMLNERSIEIGRDSSFALDCCKRGPAIALVSMLRAWSRFVDTKPVEWFLLKNEAFKCIKFDNCKPNDTIPTT